MPELAGRLAERNLDGTIAGEFLGAGAPLVFPAVLENALFGVEFDVDATHEVRVTRLIDKSSGADFVWTNDPARVGADWRMWEVEGTLEGGGGTIAVAPDAVTSFVATATTSPSTGADVFVFRFLGQAVLGAVESDTVDVTVTFALGATDSFTRVRVFIDRPLGSSFSLDRVVCPALYLLSPIPARAGGTALQAAQRAYLLAPCNVPQVAATFGHVTPLFQWASGNTVFNLTAGANQGNPTPRFLPFAMLGAACFDPEDQASYRRSLYLAAEDSNAHTKELRFGGRTSGADALIEFRAHHFPPFASSQTGPIPAATVGMPTEFGNTYSQPYDVAIGAHKALSDAWWFDCVERYRAYSQANAQAPRREANALLSSLKDGAIYCISITLDPTLFPGALLFDRFNAIGEEIKAALANPNFGPAEFFHQWQTWVEDVASGFHAGVQHPEHPILTSTVKRVAAGVVAAIATAQASGQRIILYTNPKTVGAGSSWLTHPTNPWVPATMELYGRDGLQIDAGAGGIVDYGSVEGPLFWVKTMMAEAVAALNHTGFYCDSVSGGFGHLAYDPDGDVAKQTHLAHGGDYNVLGKLAQFAAARAELVKSTANATVDESCVLSETPEEGMAGFVDLVHEGLNPPTHVTMLGEDVIRNLSTPDVPAEARVSWLPMFNAVFHDRVPVIRFATPLYTSTWSRNPKYPKPRSEIAWDDYEGLTEAEGRDIHCLLRAVAFISGSAQVFDSYGDVDGDELFVMDSGVPVVDPAIDPQSEGGKVQRFVRLLFESLHRDQAGQFLTYGDMMRPPLVDWTNDVDALANPLAAIRRVSPAGSAFGAYPAFHSPPYRPTISTTVAAPYTAGAATMQLASVRGLFVGEVVFLDDVGGGNLSTGQIASIDMDTDIVTWIPGTEPDKSYSGGAVVTRVAIDHAGGIAEGDGFGDYLSVTLDYDVPLVFASVWKSPEGLLGLVIVNWSDRGAKWSGRIDPAHYGLTGAYEIREKIAQDGTETTRWWGSGAVRISTKGAVEAGGSFNASFNDSFLTDHATLGVMLPRSVKVLTFVPTAVEPGIGSFNQSFNDSFGGRGVVGGSFTDSFDLSFGDASSKDGAFNRSFNESFA